jgi:hypothetical protein
METNEKGMNAARAAIRQKSIDRINRELEFMAIDGRRDDIAKVLFFIRQLKGAHNA